MSKLKFNSGIKTYEIEEENTGELLCVLKINTTDINMMNKLSVLGDKIQECIPDGSKIESINDLVEVDTKIRELIDDAFNEKISEKLFKGSSCISPSSDGSTLVERFIEMVSPVIASDFEEAIKKSNERISKYTDQVM